jgi:hypothetical protein
VYGGNPRASWKQGQVGQARSEIAPWSWRGVLSRWRNVVRGATSGHACCGSRICAQIAFGKELLIGLDDDASRQTQVGGQCPRRRERRPVLQPAALDRAALFPFELQPHRRAALSLSIRTSSSAELVLFISTYLILRMVPLRQGDGLDPGSDAGSYGWITHTELPALIRRPRRRGVGPSWVGRSSRALPRRGALRSVCVLQQGRRRNSFERPS